MEILDKGFYCLILIGVILTSCNDSVSTSATNPTEGIATVSVTVKPTFTQTSLATSTAPPTATSFSTPYPPTQFPFFTFPVDRHDPESVIRAYFDAWERSDSSAMASVLSSKFGQNFIFEPLESMEILQIELISASSPTERSYSVYYAAKWKDQPDTNRTRWKFRLIWDADRDSWIITNYGSG